MFTFIFFVVFEDHFTNGYMISGITIKIKEFANKFI